MKTMIQLNHPCIITFHGISLDNDKGFRYLVLEFAPCGTLRNVLDDNNVTIRIHSALTIMKGITQGLEYLHGRDFLHRDIKSLNVLMMHNLQPKLADFGLSKFVADSQQYYTVGMKGTFAWMAPELLQEGQVKFNKEADIYSLCMVFYEILSRQVPYYDARHMGIMLAKILGGVKPTIPERIKSNDLVPGALKQLIDRGWSKEVNQRPRATEVIKEIDEISRRCLS
jgi:serine/threonine protein kinase